MGRGCSSKFGTEFIEALHPAKYNYIPEMEEKGVEIDKVYFGVMAQDIKKYLESVSDEDFSIVKTNEDGEMSVDYIQLIAPMMKTIQELTERVTNLEKRVR